VAILPKRMSLHRQTNIADNKVDNLSPATLGGTVLTDIELFFDVSYLTTPA
jgi:hypothetical protein